MKAEPFPSFTDHSIVTASVSYQLEQHELPEETHLLESGKRLKKLDFNKAPWPEIKKELSNLDWGPMKEQAKSSPVAALTWFMELVIPLLERLVPIKSRRVILALLKSLVQPKLDYCSQLWAPSDQA